MAGGWSSIITEQAGRYYGASMLEVGGDVEEFAEEVFGMVWYLAGRLATQEAADGPELRAVAQRWISSAEENWREGMQLGGRSDSEDDEEEDL